MKENIYTSNLPDLLEIQRSSFCWFLSEGLAYELTKFPSIFVMPTGNKLVGLLDCKAFCAPSSIYTIPFTNPSE